MRKLILVTGPMRAGKTSLCKALFSILEQKCTRPFAIIEENQRDGRGIPHTIVLRDLGGDESMPLASRKPLPSAGYPPFDFCPEAFAWAMDRLKTSIEQGCGPVILDEIGALETRQGGGFLMAAAWAMDHGKEPLVMTIRPERVDSLLERLSSMTEIGFKQCYQLGDIDPEKLASVIADYVFSIARAANELYIQSRHS